MRLEASGERAGRRKRAARTRARDEAHASRDGHCVPVNQMVNANRELRSGGEGEGSRISSDQAAEVGEGDLAVGVAVDLVEKLLEGGGVGPLRDIERLHRFEQLAVREHAVA